MGNYLSRFYFLFFRIYVRKSQVDNIFVKGMPYANEKTFDELAAILLWKIVIPNLQSMN